MMAARAARRATAATTAVAIAVALALAPSCGRVSMPGGDGGGSRDGALDAEVAGPDAAADQRIAPDGPPATCPAPLAACIGALQALRAGCPGTGACQRQSETASQRINQCYADGVRVYTDPGVTAVLKPDGRLCYTVTGGLSGQVINQAVVDPSGTEIVRLTRTIGATGQTFTCAGMSVDVPDADRPCGDTALLPEDLQCVSGVCLRP